MFELNEEEFKNWRRQIGTSNSGDKMGLRYCPMAFTEQGVAMLSSILNSETAIKVNIEIMRIFIKLREVLIDTLNLTMEIEAIKTKLSNHSKNIELVFDYLDELIEKRDSQKPRKQIGYRKG